MANLRLGCLYSYGCRMVIEKGAEEILLDCINQKGEFSQDIIREALQKLQSYPAYRLIAMSKNRGDVFGESIVRSYWLGEVSPKSRDMRKLNHNFATLEKIKILKRIYRLDSKEIRRLLSCSISYGKLIKLNSDKIEVSETGLILIGRKIILSKRKREVNSGFLNKKKLRKNSILSIHLNLAREIISQQQAHVLKERTLEALKVSNL